MLLKKAPQILIAHARHIHNRRRRAKPPLQPPPRNPAQLRLVQHHCIIHIQQNPFGSRHVAPQNPRLIRIQHLAMQNHRIVRPRRPRQRRAPPRRRRPRANFQLHPAPPQRLLQRQQPNAKRRFRGILVTRRNYQNPFHALFSAPSSRAKPRPARIIAIQCWHSRVWRGTRCLATRRGSQNSVGVFHALAICQRQARSP
jgi:hypothetical protein